MKRMTCDEVRKTFQDYFVEHGHLIIPSSSLIPHDDPTLLLTTAGMVQIKPYFLGIEEPPCHRLTSIQKCFRTTDIESVGDASHMTFFEMLGNFSVGDYFKKEVIPFAWELITKRYGIPEDRLWATTYLDDDEAIEIWKKMGIPENRICRLGKKDNFWGPAGETGPCGPCSELHYDYGPEYGCGRPDCNPGCDCGRFVEIWNLVFMQFNQDKEGNLTPLPKPNIDTGMGLERITAVMQGVKSCYDTDIFEPYMKYALSITGKKYGDDPEADRALRVISEHGRSVTFLISDGVLPSNEGRGYVLRRLLRRAALFGRRVGLNKPFLTGFAQVTIDNMGKYYPELLERQQFVKDVILREEERFAATLNVGLDLLEDIIAKVGDDKTISGAQAFKLYDTYGFPIELTCEVAGDRGIKVDMDGFEKEMEKQREMARSSQKFGLGEKLVEGDVHFPATEFLGYKTLKSDVKVCGIIQNKQSINELISADEAMIVLDKTPFYAEMGGQVGDTGCICCDGVKFIVTDTKKLDPKTTIHIGHLEQGELKVGMSITAHVDAQRRQDIAANHTATHLLHMALRKVLGTHVQQRGSLVCADYLRFDFSHLSAMTADEIAAVQKIVNDEIRKAHVVNAKEMPYKEAVASGAIALFDEKYGDVVRVISVGEPAVSTELCGGTHAFNTGIIGSFRIVSESSIGSGLRRIEAITGRGAVEQYDKEADIIRKAGALVDAKGDNLLPKISALVDNLDDAKKKIYALEHQLMAKDVESIINEKKMVGSIPVVSKVVTVSSVDLLRDMSDAVAAKLGSAVVALGANLDGRPQFVVNVTDDLIKQKLHAGQIIKQITALADGNGGGRPSQAMGGGKDVAKLGSAIDQTCAIVKAMIEG